MCLCDQQADLTNPDFIPIHTHGCLVLFYIAGASYGPFHLLYDCFGFLAGVGCLVFFFFFPSLILIIFIKLFFFIFLFFKNCCSPTLAINHSQEELAKLGGIYSTISIFSAFFC